MIKAKIIKKLEQLKGGAQNINAQGSVSWKLETELPRGQSEKGDAFD